MPLACRSSACFPGHNCMLLVLLVAGTDVSSDSCSVMIYYWGEMREEVLRDAQAGAGNYSPDKLPGNSVPLSSSPAGYGQNTHTEIDTDVGGQTNWSGVCVRVRANDVYVAAWENHLLCQILTCSTIYSMLENCTVYGCGSEISFCFAMSLNLR